MGDVKLIIDQDTSEHEGLKVTSLEFLLPNHAIVMAINGVAKDEYPCPGVLCGGHFIPLDKIAVEPDGRILEDKPKPQFNGCHGPIVYEGKRQGEDYRLSFYPTTRVSIATRTELDHQPVIDEMVAVMKEAYQIK